MLTATAHTAADVLDFCRRLAAIPRDVVQRIEPPLGPTEMPMHALYSEPVLGEDGLHFEEVAVTLDADAGAWGGWAVEEEAGDGDR